MATQQIDYAEYMKPAGRELVYNPGERLSPTVSGHVFDLPARGERYVECLRALGKEARFRKENGDAAWEELATLPPGVAPINDIQTLDKDTPKRGPGNTLTQSVLPAREVLKYLLGDDFRTGCVGRQGVRVLFNDQRDRAVIAEADSIYEKSRLSFARRAIAAHKQQREKEKAAGMPMSPPSDALMELYRVEAESRRVGSGLECAECGWPLKDEVDKAAHMLDIHAVKPTLELKAPTAEVEIEPAKRGPGRPRKNPAMEEAPDVDV